MTIFFIKFAVTVITGLAGTLGPVWSGLVSAYVFSVFYLWRLDKFRRRRTP